MKECVEALISVNNQLDLPEAAAGILEYVFDVFLFAILSKV